MTGKLGYPPQLEGESDRAYRAFQFFCDLPVERRTVLATVKLMEEKGEYQRSGWALKRDQPPTTFKRWSKAHKWKERARNFDPRRAELLSGDEPPSWEEIYRYFEPEWEPPRSRADEILDEFWGNTGDIHLDQRIDALRIFYGGKERVPRWQEISEQEKRDLASEGFSQEDVRLARMSPRREPNYGLLETFRGVAEQAVDEEERRKSGEL